MNEQEKRYLLEFDRIMKLSDYTVNLNYEDKEQKKKQVEDDFIDFLILAYLLGIEEVGSQLAVELTPDTDKMYDAIYKNIAGETVVGRIEKYVDAEDNYGLMRLIDSEFHRVYNTATMDGAVQSDIPGIKKQWNTMMDWRVRDTHDWLEGVEVDLNERFYTYDGDSALFPGDFTLASNVVNCRCYLTFTRG